MREMDYLDFFGLREQPFSSTVDDRFYYGSKQHAEALIRLKYAIDSMKGLAVVTGDIGTGKTTLSRKMLNQLDEEKYEAALLVVLHSSITTDWLMKKIALQIGVEHPAAAKVDILGQIYKQLLELHKKEMKTVVLIDEMQMLKSQEIMEEFRGLLNMEVMEGKLITFVFFGLSEMEDILSLDEPLKQRIALRCRLAPLEEKNTSEYIKHRMSVAGAEREVFSDQAIHKIHSYSEGVPRLINTVSDNGLLEGFLIRKQTIDEAIIDSVAINLGLMTEVKSV